LGKIWKSFSRINLFFDATDNKILFRTNFSKGNADLNIISCRKNQ